MIAHDVCSLARLLVIQVVVDETLPAKNGPHELAPTLLQHLPPYSVAAVVSLSRRWDFATPCLPVDWSIRCLLAVAHN